MQRATTSASNIFRRQLCPGSERMEAGLPEEDSVQSKEGTLLHNFDANPKLDRAVLKPQQQDLLRISKELDDFVFARVAEQFGVTPTEHEGLGSWHERELLALKGTESETPGHCDRINYWSAKKLAVVIDKKFGFREVTTAAANLQLRTYAIGACEEFGAENVVVAITQPRLSFEHRVTMAAYSFEDIAASRVELDAIRKASREPDAPLNPTEEGCRYCKARAMCPALREKIETGLAIIPGNLNGTVAKKKADAAELLARCNDEELARVLDAIVLSDFIKDPAREEGRRRVKAGQLVTHQLGKEQEMRNITDAARAVSLLTLRGDLTRDEATACCDPSVGAIEDKVRAKRKCTWDEARDIVNDTLRPVMELKKKKAPLTRIK